MDYREFYRDGKFAEALTALEQSPEATQGTYGYYYNRGIIHHALGQDGLAVAFLEKARVMGPATDEWKAPLSEAKASLVRTLGANRLDATSNAIEDAGEALPLDALFVGSGALSLLFWIAFLFVHAKRSVIIRLAVGSLGLTVLFGAWSIWLDQHPLWIASEARVVKSGPGENYLDRGTVEVGMKLRVEGEVFSEERGGENDEAKARKWLRVRFNENQDSGYVPARSGLLLTDESNTPES
jgi:hypothetical protein